MSLRVIRPAVLLLLANSFAGVHLSAAAMPRATLRAPFHWQTPARRRHRLTSARGTLEITSQGVAFRPAKGSSLTWSFADIQTFYITRHQLEIRGYANRAWRLPGEKAYHFDLSQAVPPAVAAALAECVAKPSRNGDPDARRPAFATIPARHPERTGGSNGVLRFCATGIEYVTPSGRDSRSWRWADIQALAHPSAYQFTVGGYRETYSFELKQPMAQALFDRLWDFVYGRGLQLSAKGGRSENRSGIAQTGMDEER